MDPILIAVLLRRKVHFFARGETFSNGFRRQFFAGLHMHPVFRPEISGNMTVQNRSMFKSAIRLLSGGEALLFFPEATSEAVPYLRPLRSGMSRIALMADHSQPVIVVPVVINYSDAGAPGSNLLLSFGAPISVQHFLDAGRESAVSDLTAVTTQAMKSNLAATESADSRLIGQMLDATGKSLSDAESFYSRQRLFQALAAALQHDKTRQELLQQLADAEAINNKTTRRSHILTHTLLLFFPLFWPAALILWSATAMASRFTHREDFRATMNLVLCTFSIAGLSILLFIILILCGIPLLPALLIAAWLPLSAVWIMKFRYALQTNTRHFALSDEDFHRWANNNCKPLH
jgi:hypothetical protein